MTQNKFRQLLSRSFIGSNEVLCFLILITPLYLTYLVAYLFGYLSYKLTIISTYVSLWHVTAILIFALPGKRLLLYAIYILLSIIGMGEMFYISLYKSTISRPEFYIIYETYFAEAKAYFQDYFNMNTSLVVIVIGFSLGLIGLLRCCKKIQRKKLNILLVLFLGLMLTTLSFKRARTETVENNLFVKLIQSYRSYTKNKDEFKKILSASLSEIEDIVAHSSDNKNQVHILILGESTSRTHMGIYGYERNTNPRMSKMKDELYIFSDVISPHSHTIPIIRKIFTFANYEKENDNSKSLIQYVRKAGYKTYWISNQYKGDAVVDLIAESSDVTFFVNNKENCIGRKCLDSNVFLPLSIALEEKVNKKFVVIHLLGTHGKYEERYPTDFMKFTSSKRSNKDWDWMINEYDNAVLYNDYIVSTIINKVKKEGVISSVLYFSDHGDDVFDVGDFALHTETLATFPMFSIPFILWLSPEYKKENAEMASYLNICLDRRYMTDDIIHSIFDLLHIQSSGYNPMRSIFNTQFMQRKRKIGGLDFDSEISQIRNHEEYQQSKIEFDHYDGSLKQRIWVHRVNSTAMLKQSVKRFAGVELDVQFIRGENKFDVNHPPKPSINLSLDEYLGSVNDLSKFWIWLDFKNVNSDDIQASLATLNQLVGKYHLNKLKIVTESKNPAFLKIFNENGYIASYYLEDRFVNSSNIGALTKMMEENAIDTVSAHAEHLNFIQKNLPATKNILLWAPELNIDNKYHRSKIRRILSSEEKILALLVHMDSVYYR